MVTGFRIVRYLYTFVLHSKMSNTTGGRTATPSAITKDILKEALKEVLAENPALLAAAGRQPDEDAGSGKQVGIALVSIPRWVPLCVIIKSSPPPGC